MPASRQTVESPHNPLLKKVRRLGRARRREASFLIEGRKLVEQAMADGLALETVIVSRGSASARAFPHAVEVKASLFASLSTLETPDGVLALGPRPTASIDDVPSHGLIVVSAGIQDPGNLGALARVSEASGASALVVLPGTADAFGPKAVRGSMGSVWRLPVVELETLEPARARGYRTAALVPRGGVDYRDFAFERPLAVVLGREGRGLTDSEIAQADVAIEVPMQGRVESLNVSTAAAIVLFEAARRERS